MRATGRQAHISSCEKCGGRLFPLKASGGSAQYHCKDCGTKYQFESSTDATETELSTKQREAALTEFWQNTLHGNEAPEQTIRLHIADKRGTAQAAAPQLSLPRISMSTPQSRNGQPQGQLEILGQIGVGGMGVIHRARQNSLGREVAIKTLKGNQLGVTDESVNMFLSEAYATGLLEHPNIVPVHELGLDQQGNVFYMMKLIKGSPWKRLVRPETADDKRRAQGMGIKEHLEILLKVCDAIAFAHSKGIVHRDLKPENVMVGDYGEVLVVDWGLAAEFHSAGPGHTRVQRLQSVTQACGTPSYMPPEMALGLGAKIGPASDVYLLGAILFEILFGRAPHTGTSTLMVLHAAAQNEIDYPEQITPEAGEYFPVLQNTLTGALRTDPKLRQQSAGEFAQNLRDSLRHFDSVVTAERAYGSLRKLVKSEEASSESATVARKQYSQFAEVIAALKQALVSWPENRSARDWLTQAYSAYAQLAVRSGDLALAEAQLEAAEKLPRSVERSNTSSRKTKRALLAVNANAKVREQVEEARQAQAQKAVRLKAFQTTAGVMAAAVLMVGVIAFIWVNSARSKAETAQAEAETAADKAKQSAAKEKQAADQEKQANLKLQQAQGQLIAEKDKTEANLKLAQANLAEGYAIRAESALEAKDFGSARLFASCALSIGDNPRAQKVIQQVGQPRVDWVCDLAPLAEEKTYRPCLRLTPDGKELICGIPGGGWCRLDITNGKVLQVKKVVSEQDQKFAGRTISPNGTYIGRVQIGVDPAVQVFDVASGDKVAEFKVEGDYRFSQLGFTPDSKGILVGGPDLKLFDIKNRALTWTAEFKPSDPTGPYYPYSGGCFAFLANGEQFLEVSRGQFGLCRSDTGERADQWPIPPSPYTVRYLRVMVSAMASNSNGKNLAIGYVDGTIGFYDLPGKRLEWIGRPHSNAINCVRFIPSRNVILSASDDGTVAGTSVDQMGTTTFVFNAYSGAIADMELTTDERMIFTVGTDWKVRCWPLGSHMASQPTIVKGSELDEPNGEYFLAASPDGMKLATYESRQVQAKGPDDKPVYEEIVTICDADGMGLRQKRIAGDYSIVTGIAISPMGTELAVNSIRGGVTVYSIPALDKLAELKPGNAFKSTTGGLLWSSDGGEIMIGTGDGVGFWRWKTGEAVCVARPKGSYGIIYDIFPLKGAKRILVSARSMESDSQSERYFHWSCSNASDTMPDLRIENGTIPTTSVPYYPLAGPNGVKYLYTEVNDLITLYDPQTMKPVVKFQEAPKVSTTNNSAWVRSDLVLSPDGKYIADTNNGYGASLVSVQIWSVETGLEVFTIRTRTTTNIRRGYQCVWLAGGKKLALHDANRLRTIWDLSFLGKTGPQLYEEAKADLKKEIVGFKLVDMP